MISLIEANNVIRPDGTEAKRVVLLSDSAPASLTVTGADVPGLNNDDVIATGSVLITPAANYIAFADGVFTEKG
jgi:hypothetical protein